MSWFFQPLPLAGSPEAENLSTALADNVAASDSVSVVVNPLVKELTDSVSCSDSQTVEIPSTSDTGDTNPTSSSGSWSQAEGAYTEGDAKYGWHDVTGEYSDWWNYVEVGSTTTLYDLIPAGATIDGVEVRMLGHRLDGTGSDYARIALWVYNNTSAAWKGGISYRKDFVSNSDAWITFGGPTDLWGATWSKSDFDDAYWDTNVWLYALSGSATGAEVDVIITKVYYTSSSGVSKAVSDTAYASDSVSKNLEVSKAVSDTVNASDSASTSLPILVSVSDQALASDSVSPLIKNFATSQSDTATASDSVSTSLPISKSVSDQVNASDAVSPVIANYVTAQSDTTLASDGVATSLPVSVSVSDQANASDGYAAAVVDTGYSAAVSDTATSSDSVATSLPVSKAVSDQANASDSVSALLANYVQAIGDTATASDSVSISLPVLKAVSDQVNASDSVSALIANYAKSVSDQANASDAASTSLGVSSSVSDTALASDAAEGVIDAHYNAVSDTALASDSTNQVVTSAETFTQAVSDTVICSDATAQVIPTLVGSFSDLLAASDAIVVSLPVGVTASDGVVASDSVSVSLSDQPISVHELSMTVDADPVHNFDGPNTLSHLFQPTRLLLETSEEQITEVRVSSVHDASSWLLIPIFADSGLIEASKFLAWDVETFPALSCSFYLSAVYDLNHIEVTL